MLIRSTAVSHKILGYCQTEGEQRILSATVVQVVLFCNVSSCPGLCQQRGSQFQKCEQISIMRITSQQSWRSGDFLHPPLLSLHPSLVTAYLRDESYKLGQININVPDLPPHFMTPPESWDHDNQTKSAARKLDRPSDTIENEDLRQKIGESCLALATSCWT